MNRGPLEKSDRFSDSSSPTSESCSTCSSSYDSYDSDQESAPSPAKQSPVATAPPAKPQPLARQTCSSETLEPVYEDFMPDQEPPSEVPPKIPGASDAPVTRKDLKELVEAVVSLARAPLGAPVAASKRALKESDPEAEAAKSDSDSEPEALSKPSKFKKLAPPLPPPPRSAKASSKKVQTKASLGKKLVQLQKAQQALSDRLSELVNHLE